MRKEIFFLALAFFITSVSAAPILIPQYEDIQPGETFLATVTTSGEFTKIIQDADIKFYEGRKEIFMESDIMFNDATHYLYVYTTKPGIFTMKISNILYKENNQLKESSIEYNITSEVQPITEGETSVTKILSIKPGFILTTTNSTLRLTNKGNSTLNASLLGNEISLNPQASQQITIVPSEPFSLFEISTYKDFSIPIIYLAQIEINETTNETINETINETTNETINTTEEIVEQNLEFTPALILQNIIIDDETSTTIELSNTGENITNIELATDINFLSLEGSTTMAANSTQNITIEFSPEEAGHVSGVINMTYTQSGQQKQISIPLELYILPQGSSQEDFVQLSQTCVEKNGTICPSGETCTSDSTFTRGGDYCCLGTCEKKSSDGGFGYGWIIAIIIFVILAGVGFYFYKKQKGIAPKNPDEQIKETSETYENRLQGSLQRT